MRKIITTPAAAAAGTAVGAGTAVARTAVGAGTAVARKIAGRLYQAGGRPRLPRDTDVARCRVVTVLRRRDELPDTPPPALAELGDTVEVEARPAPGDRGSVLAARLTDAATVDDDPAQAVEQLREALRQAKQQLEIGWVVTPTRYPVVETPLNEPLRRAGAHAQGEGVP